MTGRNVSDMQFAALNDVTLHYRFTPGTGTPVVFLNSLGTDFRIWNGVIARLDLDAPILCIDKRGHGLSDVGPITMDLLVTDVAALMDHLGLAPSVICGVSVGGMIAQGLALARPDLVAGLMLCCTGAKIGDADGWNDRIETVQRDGLAAMAGGIIERWFSSGYRPDNPAAYAGYRNMLARTTVEGYAGVCGALRDTDFTAQLGKLKVPTHCIAGAEDVGTPPAMLQTLADLISGATIQIIPDAAHLPGLEHPQIIADALRGVRRNCA